jgi:hypothetical protein
MARWRDVVEGPRWAAFPSFLRDECWKRDLDNVKIEVEKGWVRETVRFDISGPDDAIASLQRDIESVMVAYNNRGADKR